MKRPMQRKQYLIKHCFVLTSHFKWINLHKQKNHLYTCQDSNWNQAPFSYLSFESIKKLLSGELILPFINVFLSVMFIISNMWNVLQFDIFKSQSIPSNFASRFSRIFEAFIKHKESWQSLSDFVALQWFQIISWYK